LGFLTFAFAGPFFLASVFFNFALALFAFFLFAILSFSIFSSLTTFSFPNSKEISSIAFLVFSIPLFRSLASS